MTTTAVKPSLTLKRRLNAPPAKVYGAWTDPRQLAQWWGPTGSEFLSAEMDVRVDGRYRIRMRGADGEEHDVGGVYREVAEGEKLVFTWAWRTLPERESLVTLTFKPDAAGTLFTLHHEHFFDETARDRHQWGWTGALDKLEAHFS